MPLSPWFLLPGAALLLALAACTDPAATSVPDAAATPAVAALPPGQQLYLQNCAVCHGPDGRAGLNGAHDLTKSNLNAFGRTYLVNKGMRLMPSFEKTLTAEEIEAVVAYSLTLR